MLHIFHLHQLSYARVHVSVYTYMVTCIYMCMHMHLSLIHSTAACVYALVSVYMTVRVRKPGCMRVHVCVCVRVCVHVYSYTSMCGGLRVYVGVCVRLCCRWLKKCTHATQTCACLFVGVMMMIEILLSEII